jgi:hypothetical protein
MSKRKRAAPARSIDGEEPDPTHHLQNEFFRWLRALLGTAEPGTDPSGQTAVILAPIPVHREATVPSRLMKIDGLIDLRGRQLEGGLFHLLRPWCAERVMVLEWASGDVDVANLNQYIAKAMLAANGRKRGKIRWPATVPPNKTTLLIVGDAAGPRWFTVWNRPYQKIHHGLWINESEWLTILVVRPLALSLQRGGSLWALLRQDLRRRSVRAAFQALLGDPDTATIYHDAVKALLKHHFPETADMNQHIKHHDPNVSKPLPKSYWDWVTDLKQQAENERKRAEELVATAAQRAEAEAQRAKAEASRADTLAAEVARLRALLDER